MNPATRKILAPAVALALAALLAAGSIALVLHAFSTGFISIASPSNRDLVDTPLAPAKSAGGAKLAAKDKPAAFRVQLAVIPGAASLPALAPAASAGPPGPIKPASAGLQIAPLPQVPAVPQPVQISAPQAISLPDPVQTPAAAPTDLDIALHPSLKYASWVPSAVVARPSSAALDIPIAVVGKQTAALAASLRSAPPPKPTVSDSSDAQMQELIAANLKMEDDRKFVMSMCEDQQRCLWVGTEGSGVQRFDPRAPELHQWTEFTTQDGLGDDYAYAIACDHEGRIWVGHLNHGVSVYNGNPQGHWQSYEVVGGLSKPDSLSGPIGERIFHITVCPQLKSEAVFTDSLAGKQSGMSGSVWMCTSAGLSIYFPSTDSWSYLTRADGLPSDQANSLAFDKEGNIYVGTQCDSIAIGNTADRYRSWRVVPGPREGTTDASGDGLPCCQINDLLASSDDSIWAATTSGLAWSTDHGSTWRYARGADYAAKVRLSAAGPPPAWTGSRAALPEDYITCLAERDGAIYLGTRENGWAELLLADGNPTISRHGRRGEYVTTLCCSPYTGSYGSGLGTIPHATLFAAKPPAAMLLTNARAEPAGAQPLAPSELRKATSRWLAPERDQRDDGARLHPLADDWATQGAWLGRHGRFWAWLPGLEDPARGFVWGTSPQKLAHSIRVGSHTHAGEVYRYWVARSIPNRVAALEVPSICRSRFQAQGSAEGSIDRIQAEFDDSGEAYPRGFDGPDLWATVDIPAGVYIASVYEVNDDAHGYLANGYRDYLLSFSVADDTGTPNSLTERVTAFHGGVYKRCLVRGPTSLSIHIARSFSFNTIVSAIMLDSVDELTVGYDMDRAAWRKAQRESAERMGDTLGSAAALGAGETASLLVRASQGLLKCDPQSWAANYRQLSVQLCRWYLANPSAMRQGSAASASFWDACLFAEWESVRSSAGDVPPRTIEKALRWDGISGTDSGHGYERVSTFLKRQNPEQADANDHFYPRRAGAEGG